eukprot:352193-Chlamydomonas_euryale.AAC.17
MVAVPAHAPGDSVLACSQGRGVWPTPKAGTTSPPHPVHLLAGDAAIRMQHRARRAVFNEIKLNLVSRNVTAGAAGRRGRFGAAIGRAPGRVRQPPGARYAHACGGRMVAARRAGRDWGGLPCAVRRAACVCATDLDGAATAV